jgi:tetratricopeptide (TPR) repeat protein
MKKFILLLIFCFSVFGPLSALTPLPNPVKDLYKDSYWHEMYIGDLSYIIDRSPKITLEEREIITEIQALLPDNIDSAVSLLETAITAESSAAMTLILGNLYFQRDEFKRAKRLFVEVGERHPYYLLNQKTLAFLSVRMEDFDEAVKYLKRSISLGNTEGRTFGLLGYCLQLDEDYIAAELALTRAVLIEPEEKNWKGYLAQNYLYQGRYKESNAVFQELLSIDPENPEFWLLQANGYIGLGDIDKAAANFEILKRMNKAPADSLLLLGDIYINRQMLDLAFDAYMTSVIKDPEQKLDSPIRAVSSLINYGAYDEAADLIIKIKRLYRGRSTEDEDLTLLTMQSQIAIARGEGEKAKATLEEIIKRDPTQGRALLILANFYGREGNSERALELFDLAKELDDIKAEALVMHAQLLARGKQYIESAELLREAQEIEFKENVADFLEKVEHIILVIEATNS